MTRALIIMLVLAGCRTGDNSPQPSCIYQCQNVIVEQPVQSGQPDEQSKSRKRK